MARIRTIKPEFFRHETLQDLEIANPGKYPMMVFEGLWGHCDSRGRFEWKPRQLKLDILPFLPFDMQETLEILERSGMIKQYSVDGKYYGEVPSFEKHQRLSGRELTDGEKFPEPVKEAIGKQSGSVREIPESQEGKGREGNRKGVGAQKPLAFDACIYLQSLEVQKPVADDWLKLRKSKKAEATKTAIDGIASEAQKAGLSLNAALAECCSRGWQGFKASWMQVKGVDAPSVTTSLTNTDCVCCGATGSKKIGNAWYCFQHDQHSLMETCEVSGLQRTGGNDDNER